MADSCPRCHSSALGSPDGLLGHTHTPTPHPRERPQCTLQREDLITGARGISTLMRAQSLSHVRLLAAPWTAAPQSPLSMEFSREEYWRELPRPPPGDLPDPGIKLASLLSPALVGGFFTISATWEALQAHNSTQSYMDWMLGNVQTCSDIKATAPVRTGALTNMLDEDTQGSLAEGVQKHPQSSPLFRMPEVVLKNYTKSPTACTPPSPPPAALRDSEGTKGLPMAQNR